MNFCPAFCCPESGETMYIRDYKYTPEDVDCHYCVHFVRNRCGVGKCPWLRERMEAGVVDYRQAIRETFTESSPQLRQRLHLVCVLPYQFWKDAAHFHRFQSAQAIFGYYRDRDTPNYYAALYLLTATEELFRRAMDCFSRQQIDFGKMRLPGIAPADYARYKIARCLYTASGEVMVDELADPALVDEETFHLAINAILLCRYGTAAFSLKGGASHGSIPC
jgi:hypothetical protein